MNKLVPHALAEGLNVPDFVLKKLREYGSPSRVAEQYDVTPESIQYWIRKQGFTRTINWHSPDEKPNGDCHGKQKTDVTE